MPVHVMSHRGVQFEISAEDGIERSWTVLMEGQARLTGHVARTRRSSSFRTAVRQAQEAIDTLLDTGLAP